MDLQGKIELLDDMIAGRIPAQEYPLEFQGMSASALIQLRDMLVEESREEGVAGEAGEKAKQEKENYQLHMAGHARIEIEEAMALHNDFIQNGMFGRERLESFSAMLDNDAYWNYLQENEEVRNKVREQHYQGMMGAIEDGQRSVLDMSQREAEFQGEGNMHSLIGKEREVIRKNAMNAGQTAEQAESEVEAYDQAVKAKHGHLINLDDKAMSKRWDQQYKQETDDPNQTTEQEPVGKDGSVQSHEHSTGTVAVAKNDAEVAAIRDDFFDLNGLDTSPDVMQAAQALKNRGAHEVETESRTTQSVAEAIKPLREQVDRGVEETGKTEPDLVVAENSSDRSQGQGAVLGG